MSVAFVSAAQALLAAEDGHSAEAVRLAERALRVMDQWDQIWNQAYTRRWLADVFDGERRRQLLSGARDLYAAKGVLFWQHHVEELGARGVSGGTGRRVTGQQAPGIEAGCLDRDMPPLASGFAELNACCWMAQGRRLADQRASRLHSAEDLVAMATNSRMELATLVGGAISIMARRCRRPKQDGWRSAGGIQILGVSPRPAGWVDRLERGAIESGASRDVTADEVRRRGARSQRRRGGSGRRCAE